MPWAIWVSRTRPRTAPHPYGTSTPYTSPPPSPSRPPPSHPRLPRHAATCQRLQRKVRRGRLEHHINGRQGAVLGQQGGDGVSVKRRRRVRMQRKGKTLYGVRVSRGVAGRGRAWLLALFLPSSVPPSYHLKHSTRSCPPTHPCCCCYASRAPLTPSHRHMPA